MSMGPNWEYFAIVDGRKVFEEGRFINEREGEDSKSDGAEHYVDAICWWTKLMS